MKRIFALILIFSLVLTIKGQKIAGDFMYGDSLRVYVTSDVVCRSFTDRMVLSVSLTKAVLKNDSCFYMVNLEVNQMSQCYIPTEGRVLIKTASDEVIELSSVQSANSKWAVFGEGTYTRYNKIGNTIYSTSGRTGIRTNYVVGHYVVSEKELHKMFEGVKKVRIELNPKNYDKTFSKDKVGKALFLEYELLKDKTFRATDDGFKEGF